jgi:nitroreductase
VDTYLTIASKRDARAYSPAPIPSDVRRQILDAGRLAGSARNRQPWTLIVIEDGVLRERLAETVYAPQNVRGAALVVAVSASGQGPIAFDCGRAAQNMMLAAWNEGVVSCPNGIADTGAAAALLELGEDERLQIVLSFGYPANERDPASRTAAEWSAAANRRPLDDVVETR